MARQNPDPHQHRRRLIITACSIGAILALLAGIGIYGLVRGEPEPITANRPTLTTTAPGTTSASGTPSTSPPTVPPVKATSDPKVFATETAHAIFTWETTSGLSVQDYRAPLLDVADPSGLEVSGLVADLDGYLPGSDAWAQLSDYQTRQWLSIEKVYVPEKWDDALAAGGDSLPKGTIAYTIEGVRHREGIWYDKQVSSEHDISYTAFITCQPTYKTCVLLRLSALDTPLK